MKHSWHAAVSKIPIHGFKLQHMELSIFMCRSNSQAFHIVQVEISVRLNTDIQKYAIGYAH